MENQRLLKLVSEVEGVTYYRVIEILDTSCKIRQICQIKSGIVVFKYRAVVEANIYKSEIGSPYIEVTEEEADQLRQLMQKKMLDDFQLLVDVYSNKLSLIGSAGKNIKSEWSASG